MINPKIIDLDYADTVAVFPTEDNLFDWIREWSIVRGQWYDQTNKHHLIGNISEGVVGTLKTIHLEAGIDTVLVFPTVAALESWVFLSRDLFSAHTIPTYGGVSLHVVTSGSYSVSGKFETPSVVVYYKEFSDPQYHPRVHFPYRIWATILNKYPVQK